MQQILKMSKNKRVDFVLLVHIMRELENRNSACKSSTSSIQTEASIDESTETSLHIATPAETKRQLELLGKIIQHVSKTFQLVCVSLLSHSLSEIWGLYARCSRTKRDLMVCSEALLNLVRSYQVSND